MQDINLPSGKIIIRLLIYITNYNINRVKKNIMKKKFLKLIKENKCEIVSYEYIHTEFDLHCYQIQVKLRDGRLRLFIDLFDIYHKRPTDERSKEKLLERFVSFLSE